MVVFTCNHCGESLQKPRVEKHYYTVCRRPKSLTCVDCFKDFKDEEFMVHTKCVTEEERYAAKGAFAGGIVKKGDAKQQSWTEMLKSIVENEKNLQPSLGDLFNTLASCTNVPRKKVKFMNFLKSSTGGRVNFNDIEAAWDLIEKYKSRNTSDKNSQIEENGNKHKIEGGDEQPPKKKKKSGKNEPAQNGNEHEDPKQKKSKTEQVDNEETNKFSYKETILTILGPKGTMSCKKLQKKVLNAHRAYLKKTGQVEDAEKSIKKYNKKLKKIPNVTITDEVATLVEC